MVDAVRHQAITLACSVLASINPDQGCTSSAIKFTTIHAKQIAGLVQPQPHASSISSSNTSRVLLNHCNQVMVPVVMAGVRQPASPRPCTASLIKQEPTALHQCTILLASLDILRLLLGQATCYYTEEGTRATSLQLPLPTCITATALLVAASGQPWSAKACPITASPLANGLRHQPAQQLSTSHRCQGLPGRHRSLRRRVRHHCREQASRVQP